MTASTFYSIFPFGRILRLEHSPDNGWNEHVGSYQCRLAGPEVR